eukprot:TRINITY_DN2824_c0_g1_i1.p1 TRINITY_DN2824_c0_g1~~TRINITY_DN2824_c0_g1_i1.p1  ORF type:complete len:171 (-),score=32.59 TRINITY_DN2824_c0_g1_i1:94-546(-)
MASNYQALGNPVHNQYDSPFPDAHTHWTELIYFRSWQASGLLRIFYYFAFIYGLFQFLLAMILGAVGGAGGFFLGFFTGLFHWLGVVIVARIFCEIALSVFEIRNHHGRSSAPSAAAPVYAPPAYYGSGAAPHADAPPAPASYQGYQETI